MVKVILQLYPVLPATEAERKSNRPVGRDSDKYQTAVHEMVEVVQACEQLGLWGVSVIEHHFHSEGYEIGPNPGLMNAFWAAQTNSIRVGQLGWTMSTHNPFRVAEDTAIIDHLTKGRTFVGFSRGYQARWTDILGQHYGSKATKSPSGMSPADRAKLTDADIEKLVADDRINRELFEEGVDLVLASWKNESIEHNGKHWKVPFPYEEGIEWGMTATREMGAPGEVDENGRIRRISVTPSPYTDPHPPVFVASNASIETVEYCGPRGFIPTYFSRIETAERFGNAYVDAAAAAGHNYVLGQNQALTRWIQIAETEEQARRNVELYDLDIFRDLYTGTTPMKLAENPIDDIANCGMWVVGNTDQVRDAFVEQWKRLPAEYIVIPSHFAQQPKEEVIHQLELFMTHVKPALDELTAY